MFWYNVKEKLRDVFTNWHTYLVLCVFVLCSVCVVFTYKYTHKEDYSFVEVEVMKDTIIGNEIFGVVLFVNEDNYIIESYVPNTKLYRIKKDLFELVAVEEGYNFATISSTDITDIEGITDIEELDGIDEITSVEDLEEYGLDTEESLLDVLEEIDGLEVDISEYDIDEYLDIETVEEETEENETENVEDIDTDTDIDIETEIDIDIETDTETDIDTEVDTEIDIDTETEVDADIDTNANVNTETEGDTDTETEEYVEPVITLQEKDIVYIRFAEDEEEVQGRVFEITKVYEVVKFVDIDE